MSPVIPHVRIVVFFSMVVVLAYLGFSIWVFGWTSDQALKGDTVGTWKSLAVMAVGFWIGSSSGGKAKPADDPARAPEPADQAAPPAALPAMPLPDPSFGKPDA